MATTTGWHISSVLEYFKAGASWIKLWVESNVAKLRLGLDSSGHVVLDSSGVDVMTDATNSVAKFGSTVRIGKSNSAHVSVASSGIVSYGYDAADLYIGEFETGNPNFHGCMKCDIRNVANNVFALYAKPDGSAWIQSQGDLYLNGIPDEGNYEAVRVGGILEVQGGVNALTDCTIDGDLDVSGTFNGFSDMVEIAYKSLTSSTSPTAASVMAAASGITVTHVYYAKWGPIFSLQVTFKSSAAKTAHTRFQVGTLQTGFKPKVMAVGGSSYIVADAGSGGSV